jgi:ADP-heptose:LPS heptosyltransferase
LRRLRAARYDLVVDYLGSPRTAWWTVLSGAALRVGYDLPGRRFAYNLRVPRNRAAGVPLRQFAGEAFLDPLRALGLDPEPWRAPARSGGDLERNGSAALGREYRDWLPQWRQQTAPRIALVLSASWPAKAWPAEHAARLAAALQGAGTIPLLVPGPQDGELVAAIRRRMPALATAPPTTLPELADLLAHADVFVGTDNGARHLAALIGLPTVTLFGPTDHVGWNPGDPRHVPVRTGEPCSPCDLTTCPVPGHPCMSGLTPERVLAAVRAILEREGAEPT